MAKSPGTILIERDRRIEEIAHDLAGTCRMLEEFATEDERDSVAFCEALDSKVLCCEVCEWWFLAEEESQHVAGVCDECEP